MTGSISGEADLRHWLIDYLVTNIGCTPDEVDPDLSLADLGVSSRDAVVLSGELSELLGRTVSPIDFWEHPTINALAAYLAAPEPSPDSDAAVKRGARNSLDEPIAVVGMGCRFPGGISCPEALWDFLCERRSSISQVPPQRWQPFEGGPPEVAAALARTTRWGSFLPDIDAFDAEFFEISPSEADKMDPPATPAAGSGLGSVGARGNPARHAAPLGNRSVCRGMPERIRCDGFRRSVAGRWLEQ